MLVQQLSIVNGTSDIKMGSAGRGNWKAEIGKRNGKAAASNELRGIEETSAGDKARKSQRRGRNSAPSRKPGRFGYPRQPPGKGCATFPNVPIN